MLCAAVVIGAFSLGIKADLATADIIGVDRVFYSLTIFNEVQHLHPNENILPKLKEKPNVNPYCVKRIVKREIKGSNY